MEDDVVSTKDASESSPLQPQVSETALFCEICAEAFFQPNLLKTHMLLHISEKTYLCPHCPETFSNSQDARRHVQVHTGKKPYTSTRSGKKCYDIEVQDVSETPLFCEICAETFFQSSLLKAHMLLHIGEKTYLCPHCPKAFLDPQDARRHVQTHTGEKPYTSTHSEKECLEAEIQHAKEMKCEWSEQGKTQPEMLSIENETSKSKEICSAMYTRTFGLRANKQQPQTNKKCQNCPLCPKVFSSNLIRHLRSHTAEKPYVCSHCGKQFGDVGNLRKHERLHITDSRRKHKGIECRIIFSSRSSFIQHMKSCTGCASEVKCHGISKAAKSAVSCEICARRFLSPSALTTHMQSHTGTNPNFHCRHNSKACLKSNVLKRHPQLHIRQRTHMCLLCPKAFARSNDLKRHIRIHTGERPHACTQCGRPFSDMSNLRKHELRHARGKKSKFTEQAAESFRSVSRQSPKMQAEKQMAPLSNVGELTVQEKHTEISPVKFQKIATANGRMTTFASTSGIRMHMQSHTGEKPISCSQCPKAFLKASDLKRHTQLHMGANQYLCHLCPKAFVRSHDLKRHIRIHTGERPHKCTQCGRPFSDASNLRKHELRHARGKKSKSTKQAAESFRSISRQSTMMQAEKGAEQVASLSNERKFTVQEKHAEISPVQFKKIATTNERIANASLCCKICTLTFASASAMRMHMPSHSDEKPNICPHCPKTFLKANDLKRHVQLHMGAKPYMCLFCPKAFARSHDLKRHIRIHTGERPHKCTQCGRPFSDTSNLRKHELRHARGKKSKSTQKVTDFFESVLGQSTKKSLLCNVREFTSQEKYAKISPVNFEEMATVGEPGISKTAVHCERPYVCSHCPKSFLKAHNLKMHVQTHIGAKPHRCPQCPKSFLKAHDLKRHIRIHTGEKPHRCTQCGRQFSDTSNLKKHEMRHIRDKKKKTNKITEHLNLQAIEGASISVAI